MNLEELRKENPAYKPKTPFPHQSDAFKAMTRTFSFPADRYKGALLVLPTGAGKTFTAANWICKSVLAKNVKVIWFAQSSYLLNQAFNSFRENALDLPNAKKFLNIRVVSGSREHCQPSSIDLTDDVLIITTQTAIKNFNLEPLNEKGVKYDTRFINYIENNKDCGIFIVLDEAHHAPAYGFRHMWLELKEMIPNLNMLGLTATPTYMDKKTSGWLLKIFDKWIIYEAKQEKLIAQKILAKPRYIQKETGMELPVDDKLYERLVVQHKDLPKDIVQELANDAPRNNYIINDYLKHKDEYGKTIIFADTWPQCVYLSTKLDMELSKENKKADFVFSKIEGNSESAEFRNLLIKKRAPNDNDRIINEFKGGKIEVLSNIRMLTEGVDVPDVKTVFITRQTTSPILLTQMIGRALRGEKAGGINKDVANIVMFIDEWKGLVGAFADPEGIDDATPPTAIPRIRDTIPIILVERLSRHINGEPLPSDDFSINEYIPIGWYKTEIIRNLKDENDDVLEPKEEMHTSIDFIMVYNRSRNKLESFIKDKFDQIPESWSDEKLDDKSIAPIVRIWMNEYFDIDNDIVGNNFENDLIKICRHIAIHESVPRFYAFENRDTYDIAKLVKDNLNIEQNNKLFLLKSEYEKPGNLWKVYYNNLFMFINAFDLERNRISLLAIKNMEENIIIPKPQPIDIDIELTEAEKEQIKRRDNYTCLCCYRNGGKGLKLQIDHIIPIFQGGRADVENSQTLCSECNSQKGVNAINFRINKSPLDNPKDLILFIPIVKEPQICTLTRTINTFYHCQAVSDIRIGYRKNDPYYYKWEVELYQGNDPYWLIENKIKLVDYIQNALGCHHVNDVNIISVL